MSWDERVVTGEKPYRRGEKTKGDEERLTSAQKKLLLKALRSGSISVGGFGNSQHHRPARLLEHIGFLRFGWVTVSAGSFVLNFLGVPDGMKFLKCQGWELTEYGRHLAEKLALKAVAP